MLDVLIAQTIVCKRLKLNCLFLLCFWCNQIYSNDTISILDVLDSI
ncbi:hypothetical protein MTR67_017585 [Solanum verrucosum]|uniref:Uncharacterized protein n=1 Tax=Solanum verrucosum TaxID=315347 RepID=A0AAF0QKR7_SOLVR|nr:hypothetical protein MTR67_017585 [Solanum verrucosum]